jgi:hypothetical protein
LQGFYSRKLDAVRLEQIENAFGVHYPTTICWIPKILDPLSFLTFSLHRKER